MKRHHSEFADEVTRTDGSTPKKFRTPDALSHLSERADDLIECLQALKRQKAASKVDPVLKKRLSGLSRELLPSFQVLGEEAAREIPPTRKDPRCQPPQPEVPLLTAWSPTEVSRTMPPLPPVLDPALEKASFTHAGMVNNRGERSYEQLEWLGDAYLYLISTAYIFLTFPHLPHGEMCQMREVLVRNMTLKDYSIHYGFDKRAQFPDEYGLNGRKGGTKATAKERAKVLGDIFEAHVAAIILSDPVSGVSRTASWLKALWSTTIPEQIEKRTWQGSRPLSLVAPAIGSTATLAAPSAAPSGAPQPQKQTGTAKDMLAAELVLSEPKVTIEYRLLDDQKKDPLTKLRLFTQGCFLVGYGETVELGVGTGKRKSEANERAAEYALSKNKKLINVYREKKRAIQESKKAAQEAARGLDF